jgi:hypothetical protein
MAELLLGDDLRSNCQSQRPRIISTIFSALTFPSPPSALHTLARSVNESMKRPYFLLVNNFKGSPRWTIDHLGHSSVAMIFKDDTLSTAA